MSEIQVEQMPRTLVSIDSGALDEIRQLLRAVDTLGQAIGSESPVNWDAEASAMEVAARCGAKAGVAALATFRASKNLRALIVLDHWL